MMHEHRVCANVFTHRPLVVGASFAQSSAAICHTNTRNIHIYKYTLAHANDDHMCILFSNHVYAYYKRVDVRTCCYRIALCLRVCITIRLFCTIRSVRLPFYLINARVHTLLPSSLPYVLCIIFLIRCNRTSSSST